MVLRSLVVTCLPEVDTLLQVSIPDLSTTDKHLKIKHYQYFLRLKDGCKVATNYAYILYFQEHDIELSLITMNWFLTLFSSVIHIRILLRLWDILLFEGSKV